MRVRWPLGRDATPFAIEKLYTNGFPAAPTNPIEVDNLFSEGIVKSAGEMAHLDSGVGKRALLFRSREMFDPGAFGQENQTDGDCTSHGDRNARDTSRCVEIHVKGEMERYEGRGATEPTYGFRGHRGSGMDPARAARFVTEFGFMVRKNYPDCVNFSKYDSTLGASWGNGRIPSCVKDKCIEHPVGEYLVPDTPEEAKSLFFNGYACHSGQNVGFRSKTNSEGIHERRGSWNHDMATVGYDDTREIWNSCVYFVVNSWGKWNEQWVEWRNSSDLRKILGTPIDGMITVHSDIWERYFLGGGSIYFYSDIKGFPLQKLPDYGTGEFL